MAVTGKEFEERKLTPEEVAAAEVEGYIEKIEKQAEKSALPTPMTNAPATTPPPAPVYDDMGKVVMQSAKAGKIKIVLPLDEEGVRRGLHHKVIDGIRWLAEWSVYIIKKYPGRVFYKGTIK